MTGIAVIMGVACLIFLIALGRLLPGVGGEFFGRILGIISTPFLMETSFIVLGLVLVMTLNIWRQRRDGDELVYLEEIKEAPLEADRSLSVDTPQGAVTSDRDHLP